MSTYTIAQGVLLQRVVSEMVILDAAKGEYYELNDMGGEMLRLLDELGDPSRVIASLVADYNVSRDQVEADLDGLLAKLLEHGLVHRGD